MLRPQNFAPFLSSPQKNLKFQIPEGNPQKGDDGPTCGGV